MIDLERLNELERIRKVRRKAANDLFECYEVTISGGMYCIDIGKALLQEYLISEFDKQIKKLEKKGEVLDV